MNTESQEEVRICILLATFNGANFLEEQLNSILKQTGSMKIAILASDDGSEDETVNILKKYNVEIIFGPKRGAAANFSHLIENAPKYDYYALADQDDVWFKDKLECAVEKLKIIYGPGLYVGTSELINGRILSPQNANIHAALVTNRAQGCTFVFNNQLMETLKTTIKNRVIIHDWFIHLVALLIGQVVHDNCSKMIYRLHENNDTGVPGINTKLRRFATDMIFPGRKSCVTKQAKKLLQTLEIEEGKKLALLSWVNGVDGNLVDRFKFVIFQFRPNINALVRFLHTIKVIRGSYKII